MPSAAHAQTLQLRLFLEGIEVPIIAINVQCAPNSPSVATIQIPPLAEGTKLHPRTCVHCFFLDLYRTSPSIIDTKRAGTNVENPGPTAAERQASRVNGGATSGQALEFESKDRQNDQWRLLFGGEIVGFTWTKNAGSRSIILQCEDWSNYWDYAYQADNTGIFGPGLKQVFSGASTNLFTDFLYSQGEVITNIITAGKCNTYPNLKGLSAGVIRLIEAVGGSYYVYPQGNRQRPPRRYAGQNIFFSYNELRLHLSQIIGTFEGDVTSERIMRRSGYGGMFSRAIGGQGGQVSIRKVLTALTRVIFYEIYPQACPRYKPGSYGEVTGTRRVKLKNHPQYGRFAETALEAIEGLRELSGEIDRYTENESYPDISNESRNYAYHDLSSGQDVTVSISALQARTRRLADNQIRVLSVMYRSLLRTRAQMGNVPQASGAMSTAAQKVAKALQRAQQLRGLSFSSNPKSVASRASELKTAQEEAITELGKVADTDALIGTGADRRPAQLFQQVFRPDVWFASPPRCNVIFPELYESFNYQRSFLMEPTRFLLKTNDEFFGEDVLFDKLYFAPQAGTVKGDKGRVKSMLRRDLLNHERFTGILPVFEKMGEFNVFASRAEGTRSEIKKVGLAQRSANFLYFRHRFNARKAKVSGKFNPYVAVGCPGLVIDKYVDRATIENHNRLRRQADIPEVDAQAILGTNFLGNFTQVVHSVSNPQPLGRTDINMTFTRQPDESVEFLGAIPEETTVRRKIEGADAVRSTDVAGLAPPHLYSLGPNQGRILNVQDVSDQYSDGRELELFFEGSRRNSQFQRPNVPVNTRISARELGNNPIIAELLGGEDVFARFNAYRITEEIPRFRRESVLLPAEEYIRPGWYGDIWTNSRVGEVWQELFATGSITDPTTISDLGRSGSQLRLDNAVAERLGQDASEDPLNDAPAVADLEAGASIAQAVEFLHLTYSYIRQAGLDTNEFIGAYTWRPIATLLDMFGTSDLQYSENGESVIQGFEGFHSRAVGPYNNLFGLVTVEIEDVLGVKRGSTTAQNIDIRAERREQVQRYVRALLFGNALLG